MPNLAGRAKANGHALDKYKEFRIGNKRLLLVQRPSDGWYSATEMYNAFRSNAVGKSAMMRVIRVSGAVYGDVCRTYTTHQVSQAGTWIQPKIARGLALEAGMHRDTIESAFPDSTDDDEASCSNATSCSAVATTSERAGECVTRVKSVFQDSGHQTTLKSTSSASVAHPTVKHRVEHKLCVDIPPCTEQCLEITLDIVDGGVTSFSLKQLFDSLPETMRYRTGSAAWPNTRASVKQAINSNIKVAQGDLVLPLEHLNMAMIRAVKGHGRKIMVTLLRAGQGGVNASKDTREFVLRHHKQCFDTKDGALTYQQIVDSIRRVPEFIAGIGGHGSVVDTIALITQKPEYKAAEIWRALVAEAKIEGAEAKLDNIHNVYSVDSWSNLPTYMFPAQGAHSHPVAQFETLIQIASRLRSSKAHEFNAHICQTFCRVAAGDQNMHADLDANHANMLAKDRRDMLKGVPGAAPVDVSEDPSTPYQQPAAAHTSSHTFAHTANAATTSCVQPCERCTETVSPQTDAVTLRTGALVSTVPSLSWRDNDACAQYNPEDLEHVSGHPFLKVSEPEMDTTVPPGFDRRLVFYIAFNGYDVAKQLPMYEYGWTDDLKVRLKQHMYTHGFVTSRPQILFATGDSFPKKVEDPAKAIFKSLCEKVGSNTETFFCAQETMLTRAKYVLDVCRLVTTNTWVDASLQADWIALRPSLALGTHTSTSISNEGAEMKLAREVTKQAQEATKLALIQKGFGLAEIQHIMSL
jgi:hypothetical protein